MLLASSRVFEERPRASHFSPLRCTAEEVARSVFAP
jgi:hypothetical protein